MIAERELLVRLCEAVLSAPTVDDFSALALAIAKEARALLAQPERDPANGRWYDADSIDRLVRELDGAMNGPDAARQARLCDIMGQLLQRIKAQPERKPLADMQIARLRDKYRITSYGPSSREWSQVVDFVRAVERAHGIE